MLRNGIILSIGLMLWLGSCQRASMGRHSFNEEASKDIRVTLERMKVFLDEEVNATFSLAQILSQPLVYYNRWVRQPFGVYVYHDHSRKLWTRHALPDNRLEELWLLSAANGIYVSADTRYTIFAKKTGGGLTVITAIDVQEAVTASLGPISGLQITPHQHQQVYTPADLSITIDPTENIQSQQAILLGISLVFCLFLLIFLFYVLYQYQIRSQWSDGKLTGAWFAGLFILWLIKQVWLKPLYMDFAIWNSIVPYLIYIIMALTSVIFLYRITAERHLIFARSSIRKRYIYSLLTYLLIICSFLLTARYAYFLVIQTDVALDFDNFLYSSAVSLVTILSIILLCAFWYILHNRFISEILTLEIPIKHRFWLYLGANILALPIYFWLDLPVGIGFFIIFTAIYILLYELFLEARNPSMTWMITWLIIFSGFLAILLFKYNWAKDLQHRLVLAQELISHPPRKVEAYQVAVYYQDSLISTNSTELYPPVFKFNSAKNKNGHTEVIINGRSELIFTQGHYRSIVSRQLTGMIKPISAFSYVFLLFLLVAAVLILLNTTFQFLPYQLQIDLTNRNSLRNKIQLSVTSVIFASFVLIAVVTVYYFKNSSSSNHIARLTNKLNVLVETIRTDLTIEEKIVPSDSLFNSNLSTYAVANTSDVVLYNLDGKQIAHFQGLQENNLQQYAMLPFPVYRPLLLEETSIINQVDKNNWITCYAPLKNKLNETIGFVGLPDTRSNELIRRSVNDFIGTLLNVYIFLLLLAGSVAIAVANSITKPLLVLGENLKQLQLGQPNKKLEWDHADEVGELIQNYNLMIQKLEDSALMLAQNEREMAWREMAKQVAHEIKNPLTPMKLSIQHMQLAIKTRPEEAQGLIDRVTYTIIEQIDALSQIASEFSSFAKMPKAENEKLILNEIIASAHDLFRKRDDMDINLYVPIDEIYIFADKNQLLRVFTNIIKNATQAIPGNRRGVINIRVYKEGDHAIVKISDNGVGIPDEMKDKVFYPNFTTKNSGTGLGLALSYSIIESFHGSLYFETQLHQGSDFFIKLPLMHMKDNFEMTKRVAL